MPRPVNAISQLLIQNIAVSIKKNHDGETHCGLIFRSGTGGPLLHLHLAWSFDLKVEELKDSYFFCVPDLDPTDQKIIAATAGSTD